MASIPSCDDPRDTLRIVVLQGGCSAERAVSLESGQTVSQALRSRGHHVVPVDPAETDLTDYSWDEADACFIALHGPFGEDGQVQGLLDRRGVPYTGSGPQASRLAMSKSASKERFLLEQIPTPAYFLIHETDPPETIARKAATLGYPVVVKPDGQGSSIGVTRVFQQAELPAALEDCFRWGPFGLVERCVLGRELTVSVLDQQALPVLEILPTRAFFDYEAKYHDETTGYEFRLGLPAEVVRGIEETAVNACAVIGTRGLCRVDLMLDQRAWVLEVNTVPGMTAHSLAPLAAQQAGISRSELCERLVLDSLRRAARQPHQTVPV